MEPDAAGWYADPERPCWLRWWDGTTWTRNRLSPEPVDGDAVLGYPLTPRQDGLPEPKTPAQQFWGRLAFLYGAGAVIAAFAFPPAGILLGLIAIVSGIRAIIRKEKLGHWRAIANIGMVLGGTGVTAGAVMWFVNAS